MPIHSSICLCNKNFLLGVWIARSCPGTIGADVIASSALQLAANVAVLTGALDDAPPEQPPPSDLGAPADITAGVEDHSLNADTPGSPHGKKKRKPKKKVGCRHCSTWGTACMLLLASVQARIHLPAQAKKLVAPASLLAFEDMLPWSLASNPRMGRHAVAKRNIAAGHSPALFAPSCSASLRSLLEPRYTLLCVQHAHAPGRRVVSLVHACSGLIAADCSQPCACSGELVLLEKPVATVVRSQWAAEVCHTCFKDTAAPKPPLPGPYYKRYCSRACAQADAHAGLTQGLHALVQHLSGRVQVRATSSCAVQAMCMHACHRSKHATVLTRLLGGWQLG